MKRFKNSLGFTLTEILVGLGILGILTGIATVSYQGYIQGVEKKELKNAGILFANAVNTCIKAKGWTRYRWTQGGEQCPTSKPKDPCIAVQDCKATTSAELKSKLNYTCPVAENTQKKEGCFVYTRYDSNEKHNRHCLSIQKEVSGKKLQVVVRVAYNNPSDYQILCGEMSGQSPVYMAFGSSTCKSGMSPDLHRYGFTKDKTDSAGNPVFRKDTAGNTTTNKVKEIIPCPWK